MIKNLKFKIKNCYYVVGFGVGLTVALGVTVAEGVPSFFVGTGVDGTLVGLGVAEGDEVGVVAAGVGV